MAYLRTSLCLGACGLGLYSEAPEQSVKPSLSLEQEFSLRSFAVKVDALNEAQSKALLLKMYENMMVRENAYNARLKKVWGIG